MTDAPARVAYAVRRHIAGVTPYLADAPLYHMPQWTLDPDAAWLGASLPVAERVARRVQGSVEMVRLTLTTAEP